MRRGALYAPDGACVVPRVWRATNPWDRMRGLLGRPMLGGDEALLIERCASVHTVGMRYSLDIAFLDGEGRVCEVKRGVRPLRLAASRSARATLELAAGAADALGLRLGTALRWKEAA